MAAAPAKRSPFPEHRQPVVTSPQGRAVDVVLPVWLRLALQMVIGTFAGYRLDQEAAQRIRKMGRPVLVVTAWTIGSALLIGILIGTTFNPQTAVQLAHNFLPVIGSATALVASGLVLSRALQRTLGLDAQTALLACLPVGLSQMAAPSEELGSQTFIVSIHQLTRMLTVVLILPIIFRLLIPQ